MIHGSANSHHPSKAVAGMERKMVRFDMGLLHNTLDTSHDIGVFRCYIPLLPRVVAKMIKRNNTVRIPGCFQPDSLPRPHPHGLLSALFVELPIKVGVLFLGSAVQQGWQERNT